MNEAQTVIHQAESEVIGSVITFGPAAYDAAAQYISSDSFSDPLHQQLWSVAERLILKGEDVGLVPLMHILQGQDIDWGHVNAMADGVLSARSAGSRAQIVAAAASERAIRKAAAQVKSIAEDEDEGTVSQRVARSVELLEAVADVRLRQDPRPVADFAADFLDRLSALAEGKTESGRATGIPRLDKMLSGGLRDGQLVIVAARPSVGKSSFAQQLAMTHASSGYGSGFFGMEMTSAELTNRTVANLGRVSLSNIKTGNLSTEQWQRVVEGVENLRSLPLYLYDQPAMTLAEVGAKARLLVRRYGVKTLVVDYLQLMKGGNDRNDRRVQLEEITRGLKQLAKQLGITVVLLSQLNRQIEQRTNPRPILSDLKECGAIEEDADIVLALWTHVKSDIGLDIKGLAVLKNRDGETGEVALHFNGPHQHWTESTESLQALGKTTTGKRYSEDF